jgi:hypothetical protein
MSDAIWGLGTLLKLGDGLGSYTTVAEVLDFPGPQRQRDRADITNHSSSNGYEEVLPTIKRTGEITFNVNWNPAAHATHEDIWDLYDSGDLMPWRIVGPSAEFQLDFNAYVVGDQPTFPTNAQIQDQITLKPTGVVTRT